jgi:hypothetical protein
MDIIGGSDRDISAGSGYLFIVKPPKGVRSIQSIRYSVLSPRILKLVKRSHPAGTMSQSIVAMARPTVLRYSVITPYCGLQKLSIVVNDQSEP